MPNRSTTARHTAAPEGISWRSRWRAVGALPATLALLGLIPAVAQAQRTAYVSGDGSNDVAVHTIEADGSLSALGAPVDAGTGAEGIAITPDGRHLYVANLTSNDVSAYEIASDGTLSALGSPVAAGTDPLGAAVTPDGTHLYVTNMASDDVSAYAIGADGALTELSGSPFDAETSPRGIAIAPDGRHLYVATTSSHSISSFQIEADGSLVELASSPVGAGTSPIGVGLTPDGRHLYAANRSSGDVSAFEIGADGSLTELSGSPFDAGAIPYGVAVTPDGRHLYATNSGSDDLSAYEIGADGALAELSGSPFGAGSLPGAGIAATPDGRHLYAVNWDSDDVSAYEIGAAGDLSQLLSSPFAAGVTGPDFQSLAIRPNQGPVAGFTATPAPVGEPTSFDASGSTDPDGQVARYDWDFGDGTTLPDGGPTPSHTYGEPGTYTVTLRVTDDEGCSDELVFTGQTAHCNGGPSGAASQDVVAIGHFTVENTNDAGEGSLRHAIIDANADPGPALIDFAPGVSGAINLLSALLPLAEDIEIDGPGAATVTVRRDVAASEEFRIFTLSSGVSAEISGLTIADAVEDTANGGGAIRVPSGATLLLRESVVRGNETTAEFGGGGGLRNLGELRIENSTVSQNEAAESGGGGISNSGALEVVSSTLSGNEAGNFGGAISNTGDGTVEVVSSTLSENVGRAGGPGSAIHSSGDTLTVTNSTIAANAPVALRIGSGTASLRSTIISGSSPNCWPVGTMPDSDGYNLADDDSCELEEPTDLEDTDPRLGALADHGGPTETMPPSPTSPAIDQGVASGLTTDQRGFERPVVFDDIPNAPGGDGSDIGAFELQVEGFLVLSVDPASLAFGDQAVGTESALQAVEVENAGTAPVAIGTLGLEGSDPDDFSVGPDACSDELLQPAETCTAQARFTPASTGAKQAQVVIPSNAPDSPDTVALSGTGTAAPSPPPPATTPPTNGDPPPPPTADPLNLPAELVVNRAQVRVGASAAQRHGVRRLIVRGALNAAAAGERVVLRFRAAGRQIVMRPLVQENGQFAVNRRLRGPQRRAVGGQLRVRYQGNDVLRAVGDRLRATRRAVRLRIVRLQLQQNRLSVAGRARPRARRQVRIQVKFNRPNGDPAQVATRVRVNPRGRFRTQLRVPPAVRTLGARVAITHPGRARLFGQRRGRNVGG